jgi:hypothetical protein
MLSRVWFQPFASESLLPLIYVIWHRKDRYRRQSVMREVCVCVRSVSDVSDVSDVRDESDVCDVRDESDVSDVSDESDESDVSDVSDVRGSYFAAH